MGQGSKNTAIFLTKESREGLLSFFSQLLTFPITPIILQKSSTVIGSYNNPERYIL